MISLYDVRSIYDFKLLNFCTLILLVFLNILAWTRCNFGSIFVAFFKFLTTFKDGQTFKEGQNHLRGLKRSPSVKLENGLQKLSSFLARGFMLPFSNKTLDYTCSTSRRFLWLRNIQNGHSMPILWPKAKQNTRAMPYMLLFINYLSNSQHFERIESQLISFYSNLLQAKHRK